MGGAYLSVAPPVFAVVVTLLAVTLLAVALPVALPSPSSLSLWW
jgi:hypothetical protein